MPVTKTSTRQLHLEIARQQFAQESSESLVSDKNGNFRILNPSQDNWSELKFQKQGPERRGYHTSFVHQGKLYVHGGHDLNECTYSNMWAIDIKKLTAYKRGTGLNG